MAVPPSARAAITGTSRATMLSTMGTPLAASLSKPAVRQQGLIGTGHRHMPALVPAAAAETVEISRQNGLDRGRRNAERCQGQRARRHDIVALQQLDLVRGQRRG